MQTRLILALALPQRAGKVQRSWRVGICSGSNKVCCGFRWATARGVGWGGSHRLWHRRPLHNLGKAHFHKLATSSISL